MRCENHEFDTYVMVGDDAVDCTVMFSYNMERDDNGKKYFNVNLISVKINAGMDCSIVDIIDNLSDDNETWLDEKCTEYLNKLNFRS